MNTSSPTKERFCGSFRQALGPSGCSCSPPDCPFQTAGGWFSWPEEGVQLRQGEGRAGPVDGLPESSLGSARASQMTVFVLRICRG